MLRQGFMCSECSPHTEMFSALVRELHDVWVHPACESSGSLDF